MNTDWQQFLQQRGATSRDGITLHYTDATSELLATQNATVLCDLGQFGTLRVSGEEAQTFLQNMLSNDIRAADASHAQLSSLNTPKGRMLASMLIWRDGGDYLLQLPRSLCEPIRKKLTMYVLRAKVKIENADIISLGMSGPNAIALLKDNVSSVLPKENLEIKHASHQGGIGPNPYFTIIRLGENRFQVSTTPQHAQKLWMKLAEGAREVGAAYWDWLNIRAGIPFILAQTQEQFVAQMVNFEVLGGVNFKKGCYPGQEVVARMQHLGKPKRRMYLAHIDNAMPQPGDELFSADMEGQSSGMIVNAATAPVGGHDVLAVVQITSHDAHTIHLGSLAGERLQFQPQPYPLP
ncbi:MAG: folate-binding protein [Gallionellales bacterium GWA2_60_142]|nr:MAG: folate-binding protein [Gallionellales bacterium GWA2_60_142]HCI13667.1 folate-binding protein [Gallionellaceae bacterium]